MAHWAANKQYLTTSKNISVTILVSHKTGDIATGGMLFDVIHFVHVYLGCILHFKYGIAKYIVHLCLILCNIGLY